MDVNVVAVLPDGKQYVGTVYEFEEGITLFNDGKWSWPNFNPLIKITNIKLKQK